jgi:hypothetical protein
MYQKISLGENEICNECKKEGDIEIPLSIYYVGKNLPCNDSVFFIGKTAVGGEGIGPIINSLFTDSTSFGEESLDGLERMSKIRAYYSYTHDIIKNYYGSYEMGKNNVALSNIVKCNNTTTNDSTDNRRKEYCINTLKTIWKEVDLISPKNIIFYTNTYYDDFIDAFRPELCTNFEDIIDSNIKIGKKNVPWWHRRFYDKKGYVICNLLRLSHPQRMKKDEYVARVVEWLESNRQ